MTVIEPNASRAVAADEAVDWFFRQQEPGFGAADRHALAEWLLLSPLHVEEYLAVSLAWSVAGSDDATAGDKDALLAAAKVELAAGNVVPLRASESLAHGALRYSDAPAAWSRIWRYAAILLVLIGTGILGVRIAARDTVYATTPGEQRSVVLADGSVVTLNTDSSVRVALRPRSRDMNLLRGEALFQVARDSARPFVVRTSGAEVRALGTVFNVRVDAGKVQVAVLEGHVAVRATEPSAGSGTDAPGDIPAPAELQAGDRAVVDDGAILVGTGQPLAAVSAWRERKLVFRNETLESVVGEFNRYRLRPLRLRDPDIRFLRISGVFVIEDPESLLTYLQRFEAIDIRRGTDGFDYLERITDDR